MSDGSAASRRRPRLVLTQGDPAGIGPEILLTLLTLAAPQAGGTGVSPGRAWQPLLVAERAALALGESQIPAAFGKLRESWEQSTRPSLRRTLLLALAMLRQDEALEFLIKRLEEDTERVAVDALAALVLYARDDSVRGRIDKILTKRNSSALRAVFDKEFRSGR